MYTSTEEGSAHHVQVWLGPFCDVPLTCSASLTPPCCSWEFWAGVQTLSLASDCMGADSRVPARDAVPVKRQIECCMLGIDLSKPAGVWEGVRVKGHVYSVLPESMTAWENIHTLRYLCTSRDLISHSVVVEFYFSSIYSKTLAIILYVRGCEKVVHEQGWARI